jgi:CHASE2 domain-containing sensor protein
MRQLVISNTLLSLGVIMLAGFGLMELAGAQTDPLLPACAALCIGITAVLDRVAVLQNE